MSLLAQTAPSTSAAGPLLRRASVEPIFVGVGIRLGGLGTTTGAAVPAAYFTSAQVSTTSGLAIPDGQTAASAIMEIRRRTGLTWDQLARLFAVSRRSIHFWASGKALNHDNEERVHRVLATILSIDRGAVHLNRALLMTASADGGILFDALVAGEYEEVVSRAGRAAVERPRPSPRSLAPEARAERSPPSPESLATALQDRGHREVGKRRAAKSMKVKRE